MAKSAFKFDSLGAYIIKDPGDNLDYTISYADQMAADSDTISASVWAADDGVTVGSDSNTTTTATVFISGGTLGSDYEITNTITTAGGRTYERSFRVKVRERGD